MFIKPFDKEALLHCVQELARGVVRVVRLTGFLYGYDHTAVGCRSTAATRSGTLNPVMCGM